MRVRLLLEARLDLLEASRFYDRQRDGLGDYFIQCLFEDFRRLEQLAGMHEKRGNYFRLISERFPFMICYQLCNDEIQVIAVLDCRQDPKTIDRRLESE
jgi:hypothetical protein